MPLHSGSQGGDPPRSRNRWKRHTGSEDPKSYALQQGLPTHFRGSLCGNTHRVYVGGPLVHFWLTEGRVEVCARCHPPGDRSIEILSREWALPQATCVRCTATYPVAVIVKGMGLCPECEDALGLEGEAA